MLGGKRKKKMTYIGIIAGICILLLFMMPICYVQSIQVEHNRYYSDEEIIAVCGLERKHLLDIAVFSVKRKLLELPYISSATIKYEFPGKIVISVAEKAPYVYVMFKGTYLCLNERGQVIEQSQEKYHELPVIEGIKFESFKVGDTLPFLNEEYWFVAQEAMSAIIRNNYVHKINQIDVHNMEEIHLYVDKLDVIMGDIGDFDKKIVGLTQIYEGEGFSVGQLDLSNWVKNERGTFTYSK